MEWKLSPFRSGGWEDSVRPCWFPSTDMKTNLNVKKALTTFIMPIMTSIFHHVTLLFILETLIEGNEDFGFSTMFQSYLLDHFRQQGKWMDKRDICYGHIVGFATWRPETNHRLLFPSQVILKHVRIYVDQNLTAGGVSKWGVLKSVIMSSVTPY